MLTHVAAVWCRQEFVDKDEEPLRLLEVLHARVRLCWMGVVAVRLEDSLLPVTIVFKYRMLFSSTEF